MVHKIPVHHSVLSVVIPARPVIDTSEFLAVPTSQSQHSASAGSQQLISPVEEHELEARAPISQTTIPDSQGLTEDLSCVTTSGDPAAEKSSLSQGDSQVTGLRSPSASEPERDIDHPAPSLPAAQGRTRSPDPTRTSSTATDSASLEDRQAPSILSFGERQVVTDSNFQSSTALVSDTAGNDGESQSNHSSLPRFQTQPDFATSVETSSEPAATQPPAVATPTASGTLSDVFEPHFPDDSIVPETSSYSAQIVGSIHHSPAQLGTQTRSNSQSRLPPSHSNVSSQVIPGTSPVPVSVSQAKSVRARSLPVFRKAKVLKPVRASSSQPVMDQTPGRQSHQGLLGPEFDPLFGEEFHNAEVDPDADAELERMMNESVPSRPAPIEVPTADGGVNLGLDLQHLGHHGPVTVDRNNNQFGNALGLAADAPSPFQPSATEALQHEVQAHPPGQPHFAATIAPSQLTMSIAPSSLNITPAPAQQPVSLPLYESEEQHHETVLPGIESGRSSLEPKQAEHVQHTDELSDAEEEQAEHGSNEHIITLPMFASTRRAYTETLDSHRSLMRRYNTYFKTDSLSVPDHQLVDEVDAVFAKLQAYCDLPLFFETLSQPMNTQEMKKYSTNTNTKYSFVYELLDRLKHERLRILILSQPGPVFNYLEAIVSEVGCKYTTYLKSQMVTPEDDSQDQPLHIVLETTDQDVSRLPRVDAVILFDNTARSLDIAIPWSVPILSLVVTYSIEQIDLRLSHDMDQLERRNALILVSFESKKLLNVQEYEFNEKPPHEVAEIFGDFLRQPGDLDYEPCSMPDEYFDVYVGSQGTQSRVENGPDMVATTNDRKRPFDGEDTAAETPSKRARTIKSSLPARVVQQRGLQLMSDLLKETLASYVPRPQGLPHTVEIPVDQLEWLSATIHQLRETSQDKNAVTSKSREQLIKLEAVVKSQNKTIMTQQRRLVESLREGTAYEEKLRVAEEETEKIQKQLDRSKAEVSALQEKLKAQSLPAEQDAEPKIEAEVELQETKSKLEAAEKKVKASNSQLDYIRGVYQTASNSATELARENKELQTRIADLEHLASERLRAIHDSNKDSIIRDQSRQLRDAQTIIAHREDDLERAQRELRTIKNGRRETRQTSVPRSPRVPMMSPRPRGGATSRGNSPAPAALVLDNGSSTSVTPAPGRHQTPVANPQITRLRD